jgi:hypothetical protein
VDRALGLTTNIACYRLPGATSESGTTGAAPLNHGPILVPAAVARDFAVSPPCGLGICRKVNGVRLIVMLVVTSDGEYLRRHPRSTVVALPVACG